jgi:biopolymer transport protein ExbB/TolQ
VLFLLVVLTVWMLIYAGSFFAEWLERVKLEKYEPEELPKLIRKREEGKVFSSKAMQYVASLRRLPRGREGTNEAEVENLYQERSLKLWKSLDKIQMIIRIGPSLGLIGTLIPMGTGLAALGQGDMTKLSSDLVIAFTTTVVGLAVGIVAYFFYTIRRRWVELDIKNMELATDILSGNLTGGE